MVDAAFSPYYGVGTGENSLAAPMWEGLPDRSVVLFDRGFIDTLHMYRLVSGQNERHFVTRDWSSLKTQTIEVLGNGDTLVDLSVSDGARCEDRSLPKAMRLRRVEYQRPGHAPSALLTSLLCPEKYPGHELVELYHERWDLELAYRDIKQTQLQQLESLRSRTPDGVAQEIWGILATYQLVRHRMLVVARQLKKPPARLSFKTALLAIHSFSYR